MKKSFIVGFLSIINESKTKTCAKLSTQQAVIDLSPVMESAERAVAIGLVPLSSQNEHMFQQAQNQLTVQAGGSLEVASAINMGHRYG